jgi:hypothetical protein
MKKPEIIKPNLKDKRPIAKFYRCWLDDVSRGVTLQKCRGINTEQFRAADRLVCDYQRAFMMGGRDASEVQLKREYFRSHRIETQAQALHDHKAVISRLGWKSQEILEHFCLFELTIREYELQQVPQWPKGAGTARLREALDELVEVYRQKPYKNLTDSKII